MSIVGQTTEMLGEMVYQLVKKGVTFEVRLDVDGDWVITLTGGY
jgi:hypothetical protein